MLVHLDVLALAAVALDELAPRGRSRRRRRRPRCGVRASALLALEEVGGVGAAERAQATVAQLPDALDDGVEEGAVVRGHDERARAARERRLEPLDGGDVEVVRGLVEKQQVRVRHEQPRQRHARLLAARQLARRCGPACSSGRRARRGPPSTRRSRCSRRAPRSARAAAAYVGRLRRPSAPGASRRASSASIASTSAAPARGRPRARVGAAPEGGSRLRLLGRASRRASRARRGRDPPSGSSRPATIRAACVLPAPFGTRRGRPARRAPALALTESRMTNVADLAAHALEAQDGHARSVPCAAALSRSARDRRAPLQLRPRRALRLLRRAARREPCVRAASARPPAAAGTTSRSACRAARGRAAGSAGRSAGTAARCAGRRRGAPASRRRPRVPCSRRPRSRAARWPRAARPGWRRTGVARRAAAACATERSGWSLARQSASSA